MNDWRQSKAASGPAENNGDSRDSSSITFGSLKFIYFEKGTKCCEISIVDLTVTTYIGQIHGKDFEKFCGLLRVYEL